MLKILKNHAIGIDKETKNALYEFVIFNTENQTQTTTKLTSLAAIEKAQKENIEAISILTAQRRGYLNYKKTL